MSETISVYGVYFICCINNYLEVVEEQFSLLDKGLIDRTKKLLIFITKYSEKDEELNNLILRFNKCDKFVLITSSDNLFEKYAINNYKKYINETEYYVYYFHTKGIKPDNHPLINVFASRRKILNYYTLEKYLINIKLLEYYDAIGCSLHLYPKKHFSGNFWWSKSSHVNKLSDINEKYLSPEMYILSNEPCKYISLDNDTNNILYENYIFRNEEEILKNITNDVIIIDNHKKLIDLC
jgi:hypothetical protein